MTRPAFILFILIALTSFNKKPGCLSIKFRNSTDKDFIDLKIWTVDGYIKIHDLKKGETSELYTISWSYKYTYAEANTASGMFITPGTCHSGEKKYDAGELLMEFMITPRSYQTYPNEKPYLFIKPMFSNNPGSDLTEAF